MSYAQTKNPSARVEHVRRVFDRIARRYDLLNDLFSAMIRRRWIKALTRTRFFTPDMHILDVCTGTAEVAMALARRNPQAWVTGLDVSEAMLDLARAKIRRAHLTRNIILKSGDAFQMPFEDQSFDAVFNSYGLRNQGQYAQALAEMARVLKIGGQIHILEFSQPKNIVIKHIYMFYLTRIMPAISFLFLKERASFDYLAQTIARFPSVDHIVSLLQDSGFRDVSVEPLTGGIACIYRGARVRAFEPQESLGV